MCCVTEDLSPDVVLITESWCNNDITDAFLEIPGFELKQDLRREREDTAQGRGGGLLVYAKKGMTVIEVDTEIWPHQSCKFKVDDLSVTLVYRPPSAPADSISVLAEYIQTAEKNSLLIGDFNLPDIDWRGGTAKGRSREFLDAMEDSHMSQMVDFATHIKGNILDLVITNSPERITEVYEAGRLGKSDHAMIMVKVRMKEEKKVAEGEDRPDWAKGDWDGMR